MTELVVLAKKSGDNDEETPLETSSSPPKGNGWFSGKLLSKFSKTLKAKESSLSHIERELETIRNDDEEHSVEVEIPYRHSLRDILDISKPKLYLDKLTYVIKNWCIMLI